MSFKVEQMEEKNMVKLVIESTAEEFEAGLNKAYNKDKNKISIPGFRKGKAPRKMIEQMYGAEVFYEDAANAIIPEAYATAAEESKLEIVSQPKISVVQLEKGKPFIFAAEVAVKPEVELGTYKGVEVEKADTEVTDADVEEELKKVQEQNSRTVTVEDRAVKDGDMTVIDFEGFVDGVAFDGGKGSDYALTLGSGTFIPGFEDQLVGANTGDHVEVKVTFPEEYQAKELAGKEAVFQCDVKKIETKEVPELDDEFAKDVSEFDTLAEYKEDVKKKLTERKEADAHRTKEDEAIEKIIDDAKMDIPEAMIDNQVNSMINDFANNMMQQGLSMEQYMQFTGMTMDKFKEQVRPDAVKRIQSSLVLEQIAKDENLEVTDADVDAEIEKMAAAYGMEVDKVKEYIQDAERESMKKDIAIQKAADFIMENVKERAKRTTKKAAADEEKEPAKKTTAKKTTAKKTTKKADETKDAE